KYSEGYPGNRYYGGTENVDITEQLAIDRAKQLFQAEHANVQPLSGAPANIAAYFALLKPGDTILGMDLSHGGHLTHGHPVTSMSKIFNFIRYKTDKETGLIDYDNLLEMAKEHQPKLILVGYSAYSREIDYQKVQQIADEVGALTMADIAHIAGLIAAGVMNNPVPIFDIVTTTTHKTLRGPRGGMILCKEKWAGKVDKAVFPGLQGGPHEHNIAGKAVAFGEALKPEFKVYAAQILKNAKALENKLKEHDYKIMFGTTENHLLLIDVSNKNLSGKQAQELLDSVGITCNKNMIPDDPRSPMDPSGIRLGTPAMTSRGFTEQDFELVGELIAKTLANPEDQQVHSEVKQQIQQLTTKYPLYPELNN
ncbi:serine hydroxymethyltransferase, partial [Candidatus Falkowbacteria bacterium]|nr:serine hydroxymethyltransferase [Candidatus Falkowbacteria bacterium]